MKNIVTSISQHPLINDRPVVKQFMKFGIVGVLNTVIDYSIFTVLVYAVHVHFLLANAISFSIAVTNSYLLNRRWTFRSDNPAKATEAMKFLLVNLIGLSLSEVILKILVDHWSIPELIAKGGAVVVVLTWNFLGTRLWAFKRFPSDLPA
jgi:putative flippase GtrA